MKAILLLYNLLPVFQQNICYISRMCLFLKKPAVVVWLFLIFLEALMIQVYSLIFMLMMR